MAYQLGTYFLANDEWDSAIVEITRTPSLKLKDGEEPEAYEHRVYGDVLSRPGHYFLGWDRKAKTFGTRFWRSEFDLEEIYSTYVCVLEDIKSTLERGTWYPNNLACHVPSACVYLPIRRSGVVSEEIYERRRKGGNQPGGSLLDFVFGAAVLSTGTARWNLTESFVNTKHRLNWR